MVLSAGLYIEMRGPTVTTRHVERRELHSLRQELTAVWTFGIPLRLVSS